VRLVDVIFRGGHLSEQALIEAVMTGERPVHMDRCDLCAERAVDLGRWLDQVRATGNEAVDAVFPPERMVAQQQQILRKLEQLDQPSRVISFPNQSKLARDMGGRRVAAGWLAVAAAAGVVLGVASSQVTARLNKPTPVAPVTAQVPTQPSADQQSDNPPDVATNVARANTEFTPNLIEELDRPIPASFEAMASMTPRVFSQPRSATIRAPK
jgi:hypothetical protein